MLQKKRNDAENPLCQACALDLETMRCKRSTNCLVLSIASAAALACTIGFGQTSESRSSQISGNNTGESRSRPVAVDGTVVLVNGVPFFARIIQHNGEPFEFLKSVGFNAVQLPATATQSQLDQARRLGMWIICPPPASTGINPIPFSFDPVIAWTVGEDATGRDIQNIRESVREIGASDQRPGRPIMANVDSHWQSIGSLVDILSIGTATFGSSFVAKDYSDWIIERSRRQIKPFWIDIPTLAPVGLERQASAMIGTVPPLPVEHQQLKFLAYEAITGGGRGLRFLSNARLDARDPQTQLRALSLRWLLRHIDQIEPWASGGLAEQITSLENKTFQAHSVQLGDSRLILIQQPTGYEQLTAGNRPLAPFKLRELKSGVSDLVHVVDEAGASLLSNQRSTTGVMIRMEACPWLACVLVTQNPALIAHVNQTTANQPGEPSNLDLRIELTRQSLAIAQLVEQQLAIEGQAIAFVAGSIVDATTALQTAQRMRGSGSSQHVLQSLELADARIAALRSGLIKMHSDSIDGVFSSPLLAHFGLIPAHLRLAGRLSASTWNPNGLTGGGFENLQQMSDAGWVNQREDMVQLSTQVELSTAAAVDGRFGLKMSVVANGADPNEPVQAIPVWIRSAEVAVNAGQLVRIHGYVNVPQEIFGSQDGLLITDTLGGPDLASRIRRTSGWQEFTLYRGVPKSGQASVTFALTGYGQALIDNVTIRTMDIQQSTSQADSNITEIK